MELETENHDLDCDLTSENENPGISIRDMSSESIFTQCSNVAEELNSCDENEHVSSVEGKSDKTDDFALSELSASNLLSQQREENAYVNTGADFTDSGLNESKNDVKQSEGKAGLDSDSDSEEGFLRFLFRRSTLRRSFGRRSRRTSKQVDPQSPKTDRLEVAGSSEAPQSNLRRSLRRLFRRNESFCQAQGSNLLADNRSSNDANNTDHPDTELTDLHSDETPDVQENREIVDSRPSSLRRNENRRSVRFNLSRASSTVNGNSNSAADVPDSPYTATENVIQNILRQVNQSASFGGSPEVGSESRQSRRSIRRHENRRREESPVFSENDEDRRKRVGFWPHSPCSMLAAISCTLTMSNICRFSFLSFQYGGGFILQFIFLSIAFGFPMLSFFMTLGQYMGSGVMDMWKVSPVFQGIGVASLIATSLIGIYTIIPISWMFVYFRDSFVTNGIFFKWAECTPLKHDYYCHSKNYTSRYRNTVPEYFHSRVLLRSKLNPVVNSFGDLNFENVFNLAVVWLLVFICLSKGLKSYGKVVFAFAIFPLLGFLIFSVELLRQAGGGTEHIMNMNTNLYDVFLSGASWVAAAREVFFTWGLHGAVLMQITSHNPFKNNIKRDTSCVILVTLSTLLLASFLACSCFAIVYGSERGMIKFYPSSFENEKYIQFLAPNPEPWLPLRKYWSNNFILGEEMINVNDPQVIQRSNYQVFRLVTELFPVAIAYLGANRISPFWSVLLYLTFIAFGLAQQLAIWRSVIEAIVAVNARVLRKWETTITFATCVLGFVFGLPLATERGIFVVYFLDFVVGSAWWIMIIYLMQILAVFVVRGKPYSADQLVTLIASDKFSKKWLSNIIAFSWNVITPVGLLVLAITSFRSGTFKRIFNWYDRDAYQYWPSWIRQIGTMLQLIPLACIPIMGLIQTCRYMANGPEDLFDRLQMLYRPAMRTPPDGQHSVRGGFSNRSSDMENRAVPDDPPPKYTPPPSYSTATGLSILKRLNSLRRSFRPSSSSRQMPSSTSADVEMATPSQNGAGTSHSFQAPPPVYPSEDVPSTSHIPSTSS